MRAINSRRGLRWPHGLPLIGSLLCPLVIGGVLALTHRSPALAEQPEQPAVDLSQLPPSPDDVAPSAFRERVADRRDAGTPLPDVGVVALEEGIQDRQSLSAKYFQEVLSRDAVIKANTAELAIIAKQLGLPKDRLTPAPAPAQDGVGAFLAVDRTALPNTEAPPAAKDRPISSVADLANLVNQYMSIPCPLTPGHPLCGQAVSHARAELARGHGLDLNRPDAFPTVSHEINQEFGPTDVGLEPLEPVNGQLVHFHEGVDLPADYGDPVMAAGSGVVVFAGFIPSGALTVEIAHPGGLHSLYLHEQQLFVELGQQVQKGQLIGAAGATGMATGPHVHFQINDASGKPIDPMRFIG